MAVATGDPEAGQHDPTQPLLPVPEPAAPDDSPTQCPCVVGEVKRVMGLAVPIMCSELISFVSYLITSGQVGRLGATPLSSFTLARSIFHITGLSLVAGLGTGSDTFSGQAFGAQQYPLVGIFLQRASLVNLLVAACVVTGWWVGGEALMALLHQPASLVPLALQVLRTLSPSLLIWSIQGPMGSYFATQGVVAPMVIISSVFTAATPLVNHLFITTLNYGVVGAAMAYNVLQLLNLFMSVIVLIWLHKVQKPGEKTWCGLRPAAALSGWGPYLRIAIPAMGHVCADWWCFEIMTLIAGLQPDADVQLGVMGILFATHSLAFMVSTGYGTATATRVANELGAGHGLAARQATAVSSVLALISSLLVAAGLVAFRNPWSELYSTDSQVLDAIQGAMFFLAVSVVFDCFNTVLSGALRGCGYQAIGFFVNITTFWAVGIPLAYKLDLGYGLGARGVWMALAGASLLQASVLLITVSTFNWKKLAIRAKQLVAEGHGISASDLAVATGGATGHHGVYEPLPGLLE